MRDHRKLRAFQLADGLVIEIYKATRSFPREEQFGITSQIRRAAISVAVNFVEGCAREGEKEYRHFLNIAFGSLRETGYYLDLAIRLRFLPEDTGRELVALQTETAKTLSGLMRALR